MLQIKLICVGSLKEKYWREACAEYEKRLSTLCNFKIVELSESKPYKGETLTNKGLEEEADAILAAAAGTTIFPLCIEGEKLSSKALSATIDACALRGDGSLSFVIGSSHGLSERVKRQGKKMLSMSDMTFPHQLARVMLCEQIYRAFQIQKGTKYHK